MLQLRLVSHFVQKNYIDLASAKSETLDTLCSLLKM